ncbi:UTP--GLUCOSE-1-PHOSPHATE URIDYLYLTRANSFERASE 3 CHLOROPLASTIC [Salix viminalis]|uniref:UTP--GLUCOSE-1-PHOSPHATE URIDYLYLTRANSFERASE 3 CHLOROPLASTIC n=1 Tax=Salix viminalis TaxID=40686 RepID=A0A9Q0TZC0_SALVM|nr:UTP--GLUCOSE-1-PHOSPHATE URIDYLYLTRANSFERASE 3 CHLOROPLASTIC [Salix viminalis]
MTFLFSFNSSNLFNKSLPFKKPPPPPLLSLSSSPSKSLTTRVSIAPVEYAPPAPDSFNFHQEISRLQSLRSKLAHSKTLNGKQSVLNDDSRVKRFFKIGGVPRFLDSINLTSRELFLLKCLVAAGQEHVISLDGIELVEDVAVESVRTPVKSALYSLVEMIEGLHSSDNGNRGLDKINYGENLNDEEIKDLKKLLKSLVEVEEFYDCIGGVIGYQIMVLELLFHSTFKKQTTNWSQHTKESMECQFLEIHPPSGLDLSKNTEYASQAALWGIEGLPDLGEIYPLGGSADRLGLVDPDTGECLPAAMLPYCGRTLLEGLIRDLQAREFLHFKIYGKQCITPVAIMTSSAKNNHEHITSLCERLSWFGRGQSSFQLFEQPLVPAVSAEDGQWLVTKPFAPVCKPGGHGVIWKLAYDKGIFKWFYDHDKKGATVRQVSNVVAATDLTLLALAGIGLRHKKKLGFASCGPCSTNGLQAEFPANTNILYVDLPSLELVASSNSEKSLPGMVLNTKKPIVYMDTYGNYHSVSGGRLECTMQNIADNFTNTYSSRCYKGVEDKLDTFIVYNERRRVTSSSKRIRRHSDNSLHQTPDGALLDILRNAYDLLSHCDMELPQIEGNDKYVESGPPFLIFLHPALGPLWEVTRQKFNGGSISKGSELQIEVAEFSWRNVQLDGSLIIIAENVTGSTSIDSNGEPILQYGNRCGRCRLQHVKVVNRGINWSFGDNIYWKHDVQRFEALKVILHGNAEFEADNVTIQGNQIFEIPDGYKMKITSGDSGLQVQLNPLEPKIMDSGSWHWNYKIHGPHVQLELVET